MPTGQEQIAGRYEVLDFLGRGGWGTVHRAYDSLRGEHVALKKLVNARPDAIARFKREFRTLADVSHPNLVALYELSQHESTWFFTMQWIRRGGLSPLCEGDGEGVCVDRYPDDLRYESVNRRRFG